MAQAFYEASSSLPCELSTVLCRLPPQDAHEITEIRLRTFGPVVLRKACGRGFLSCEGALTQDVCRAFHMTAEEMQKCFHALCGYSVHSMQAQINQGYLSVKGGHRAGVCGTMNRMPDGSYAVQQVSAINLRIARDVICEIPAFLTLPPQQGMLIAGQPSSGKTTLLRSLVRRWAQQCCVSVVDERQELFPSAQNRPFDCDVFSGYPKHIGMQHALRAFAPQILVCDEIGGQEDAEAVCRAVNAGVCVVASVHADDLRELKKRPPVRMLLQTGAFTKAVFLKGRAAPGQVRQVYDLDDDSESAWSDVSGDAGWGNRRGTQPTTEREGRNAG